MSENDEKIPTGNSSSGAMSQEAEPVDVWIKIEQCDLEEETLEPESKSQPVFEPVVKLEMELTPLASSSNPDPQSTAKDTEVCKSEEPEDAPNITEDSTNTKPSSGQFSCDHCGRMFSRASSLTLHLRSHDAVQRGEFECQLCHKQFPYKMNLTRHHDSGACLPRVLTCLICHKQFKSKFLLRSHMTSHSVERPYNCDVCGKRFKHSRYLRSHMTSHNNDRPFDCDVCGKLFKHSSAASSHKRRHFVELAKKYSCSVCEKSFAILNALECHMRMHTKERPFQCSVCLRGFSHKHNMLRHMQRHDKVLHLKCEICNKEFPRESRLKYHMRVHYVDKKPYNCGECHKTYSHVQNITRHYRKKHPNVEYIAPVTDAEFANRAWERRMAQGEISGDTLSGYILPEYCEPKPLPEEQPDTNVVLPELVILDNNCIKVEVKQEVC